MVLTYDPFGGMIKPPLDLGEIDAALVNGIPNYDLHGELYFNEVSEITFTSPMFYTDKMGDYVKSAVYDKLDLYRKVKLSGFGTFEIVECNEVTDGVSWVKNITAKSAENEFTRKKVTFEINQGTETSLDGVKLFDDNDTEHSLMHIVMKKLPHWGYGHIDPTIRTRERSFDVEDRDVYSFLQEDAAKAFGVFFTFDTDRELINIYAAEDVGEDTDVYITAENLAETIDATANTDDIVTKVRVQGDDTDVTVREYNLGQEYIVDISYFLDNEYMPQELVDKYKAWQELFESKRSTYEQLLTDYNEAQEEWLNIYNKQPESTDSKNWSEYGMAGLLSLKAQYENSLSVEIDAGHGSSDSIYHDRYLEYYNALNAIKAEIEIRQAELDTQQSKIDTISQQMAEIADEVAMENNFTEDEVNFLSRFEYEGEYSDDAFLITDDESMDSISETKRALYEEATKWLHNVARPQYSFTMDLGNLLAIPEFAPIREKFALGNYILIEMRPGYITKARINKISINFEDFSDFSVEFGSIYNMKDNVDKVADALDKVNTSSNTVSAESSEWQKATDASRKFMELYQTGLNASLIQIKNNDNEEVLINHMGIKLQKKDPDTLVYDNHVVMLTSTGIYFSDDNLQSLKAALGEVTYEDQTFYGLIAEAVVSGIVKSSIIYASEIHSGYLGKHGWTIGEDAIYNGKPAFDSEEWGMYIGRDEINAYDTFKIDRNGRVTIEASSLAITGKGGADSSFDDYIDSEVNDSIDKTRSLVAQLSNDFQAIPVDSDGNYSYFPECKTQISVFFGSADISAGATYEIEESSGITGSWNLASQTYTVSDLTEDTGWVDITASYQSLSVTKRFSISKQYSGKDGSNGVGVKSVDVWYYLSSSPTALTGGSWSTNAPQWSDDKYIWTKTIVTYTDNSTLESKPACITGNQGTDGENGVGIQSIIEEYYQSTSATELKDGQWQTTPPEWVSGKYIWTRSTIHYTDGTSVTTDPVNSTGADGKDGNGVKSITEEYYQSTSATAQIGGSWSTTYPGWQKGTYIWTRSVIEYTDGGSKVTSPICVSGTDGADGEGGTGIESVDVEYYQSTSSSSLSGGSWSTTAPTWVNGKYIWSRTKTVYTDGRTEYSDPACITGQKGENGADGVAGRTYFIEASASVIKKGADNALSPSSITFHLYYRDGQSASRTAYYGRIRIQETINGYTTTKYTSSSNESSTTYSPSASATNITCTMYASGSTTTTLDVQSVAILKDIDNLTREEVFNIWTDNGRVQGLFMDDNGYLYFNGEYVQSHTITAEQIKSGTITAEQIASGTITADKIRSNAITSSKIAADAITSEKIAANAITADMINSGIIKTDDEYKIRYGSNGYITCIDSTVTPYSNSGVLMVGIVSGSAGENPHINFKQSNSVIEMLCDSFNITNESGTNQIGFFSERYSSSVTHEGFDLLPMNEIYGSIRISNHGYLYPSENGGFSLGRTANGETRRFSGIALQTSPDVGSTENEKADITLLDSAINDVLYTDVYCYRYKSDINKSIDYTSYGFIIGDNYNISRKIIHSSGTGINEYNAIALLYRAFQEEHEIVLELQDKIEQIQTQLADFQIGESQKEDISGQTN